MHAELRSGPRRRELSRTARANIPRRISEMRHLLLVLFLAIPALAQLTDAQKAAIDDLARKTLAETGVPAASVAVVKDGKIALAKAYGDAKLNPKTAATPGMRFKVASNSKQFAATAVLLSRSSTNSPWTTRFRATFQSSRVPGK